MIRLIVPILICIALCSVAQAQQKCFLYIESSTKEPFYLLLNGKTNYSSSINGFLTIPKLVNGNYDAEIGFVGNKYPEQHFIVSINSQDLGFLLKPIRDSSFGLVNLQTYTTVASSVALAGMQQKPGTFTNATVVAPVKQAATKSNAHASKKIPPSVATKLTNKPECIIATNADFLTLRKQMAAAATEEEMIEIAKQTFAKNCFSAEQVKNLSLLILSESNKLAFFIAAKPSIYDASNYASLKAQLTKPAIIQQFQKTL
ncbi:DUF4476 domain-containing protein [Parasediminibacterium sp. JCM 36343]|uniref:DUF4476 domain-containing protein n=1 Tax=Parasediminibacterium sp. JCM 36343 TaxID=3374279 RepID=UPI0039789BD6